MSYPADITVLADDPAFSEGPLVPPKRRPTNGCPAADGRLLVTEAEPGRLLRVVVP